ncbi:cupin domain-containing protein [Streptomyces sp. NPDC058457]|uniref:cupin domain-containing protein n=1 Tax=Streptomyces sp. NPDC058457 TaxID=3346507 RepID=UPI00366461C8
MTTDDELAEFRRGIAEQREPLPRGNKQARMVIRGADLKWYTPPGHNPSHLAPVLGTPIRSFELFMQELPPGMASDMQQHHHEAVHCILSGSGYSEIGDQRWEWEAGDFVCVPPMEWHRHYNGSDEHPVRMLLVENSRLLDALGLNYRASEGFITWAELVERQRSNTDQQGS